MFISKLKSVVMGLACLAALTTGVGWISSRTSAQSTPDPVAVAQKPAQPAKEELDPRKLKQEIERLRRELEQTRAELLAALRENVSLKARAAKTEATRKVAIKALEDLLNDQPDRASRLARNEAARVLYKYLHIDSAPPKEKSHEPP